MNTFITKALVGACLAFAVITVEEIVEPSSTMKICGVLLLTISAIWILTPKE